MMNLTNNQYGRLTVLGYAGKNKHSASLWRVRCLCGKEFVTLANSLRTSNTTSCGCARIKHGESLPTKSTPEYRAWCSMIHRCEYPKDKHYRHYGGRGIAISPRWRESYQAFLADMGRKPSPKHSLDRINNDGNYEPQNCRWALPKQQARNKSTSRVLIVGSECLTIAEWVERTGIGYTTIRERIKRGWAPESVVSTPVRCCIADRAFS